jgi:hypothetical protein
VNLIVGDSHSRNIKFNNSIHHLCIGGSAKGLNNKNSKSNYNNEIIKNIINNNYKNIFFLFGGVDVDFSFIYKYIIDPKINYIDFNYDVVQNYLIFIKNNFHNKSVIILSVGLPTVDDDNFLGNYIHNGGRILDFENINIEILKSLKNNIPLSLDMFSRLSQKSLPNIYIRTQITLNFNEQLQNEINKLNIPNIKYLDITSFTYDEKINRIKNEFFTKNDHHNYKRNIYFTDIINNFLEKLI